MHFEDDSGRGLWVFGEDEWDLFQHKCEGKQSEKWENDTCKAVLWTMNFDRKCRVWTIFGDGRVTDVDEGTEGKEARWNHTQQ